MLTINNLLFAKCITTNAIGKIISLPVRDLRAGPLLGNDIFFIIPNGHIYKHALAKRKFLINIL